MHEAGQNQNRRERSGEKMTDEWPPASEPTAGRPEPWSRPTPPPPTQPMPSQPASESTTTAGSQSSGYAPATYGPSGAISASAKRGLGTGAVIAIAALTALIVGFAAGVGGFALARIIDDSQMPTAYVDVPASDESRPGTASRPADGSIAAIAEAVLPSVVSIIAEGRTLGGTGSGFILRADGYIVTNNHVIEAAVDDGEITVAFIDGEMVPATIVGRNASSDLAVLKVNRSDLPPVALGNSNDVRVGDTAIAIGAPLGLDGTVTTGIISSLDRPVTTGGTGELSYMNAIQTDAAINPGNSGGPLLNGKGEVIGVNSAIATTTGGEAGNIGLGFAIPINSAARIANEIIATGTSRTTIIGVTLDLRFTGRGARVSEVTAGGPADAAGILPGDVITAVDGRRIGDATELVVTVRSKAPGDEVEVGFTRDDKPQTAAVTLGASAPSS